MAGWYSLYYVLLLVVLLGRCSCCCCSFANRNSSRNINNRSNRNDTKGRCLFHSCCILGGWLCPGGGLGRFDGSWGVDEGLGGTWMPSDAFMVAIVR